MIDEELLKKLNKSRIHELRDIARGYGVKSPTSLTKSEIIAEITAIMDGSKEPYMNKSKVGRPPINAKNMSLAYKPPVLDYLDQLSSRDLFFEDNLLGNDLVFNSPNAFMNSYMEKEYEIEGYFSFDFEAFGGVYTNLLSLNMNYKIPFSTAASFGLRTGDFVKCVGKRLEDTDNYLIHDVLEINGVPADELKGKKRPIFEQLDFLPLDEKINYRKSALIPFNILKGGRYLIKAESRKGIAKDGFEIAKCFAKDNTVIFINVNGDMDSRFDSAENVNVFNIPFEFNAKNAVHAVNLILASCKRILEMDKDIVVVLTNLGELIKIRDMAFKNYYDNNINVEALDWFNKVIACSKRSELGSLTFIVLESFFLPERELEMVKFNILPKFTDFEFWFK